MEGEKKENWTSSWIILTGHTMLILYKKEEKAFEQGKFTSGMLQVQSCSEYKRNVQMP